MDVLGEKTSPVLLCAVAFSEAIFFPIPPEVLLIPMSIAKPRFAVFYAGLSTVFSVLGAVVGYGIGGYFMGTVGTFILDLFHLHDEFALFQRLYQTYGGYITFVAAFTPIPYKVFAISSGALGFSLPLFITASLFGRGLRYFLIAVPFWIWRERARAFVENHLEKLTLGISALIIAVLLIWHFVVGKM